MECIYIGPLWLNKPANSASWSLVISINLGWLPETFDQFEALVGENYEHKIRIFGRNFLKRSF